MNRSHRGGRGGARGTSVDAPATRPAGGGRSDDTARSAQAGQASVEVVALAPLVVLLATAVVVALQAHRAGEAAGQAAHAAGIARLRGGDPEAAARAAVPDLPRERLTVRVSGDRVVVRVRAVGPRAVVGRFDAERTVDVRRAEDGR